MFSALQFLYNKYRNIGYLISCEQKKKKSKVIIGARKNLEKSQNLT